MNLCPECGERLVLRLWAIYVPYFCVTRADVACIQHGEIRIVTENWEEYFGKIIHTRPEFIGKRFGGLECCIWFLK